MKLLEVWKKFKHKNYSFLGLHCHEKDEFYEQDDIGFYFFNS